MGISELSFNYFDKNKYFVYNEVLFIKLFVYLKVKAELSIIRQFAVL